MHSWKNTIIIESVEVGSSENMPKKCLCWPRFRLRTLVVTILALTSKQYRQRNNQEATRTSNVKVFGE